MALNDSFELLKNLLSDTVQAAAKATRGAAAVTKANINILSEQDKLKKAYLELGKLYYRDYITGEEPDDAEYLPLCDAISEATKNIETLRGTVEEIRSTIFKTPEEDAAEDAEEVEEEPKTTEDELAELHQELDELEKELEKLDGVEKPEDSPIAPPVIEVVDDTPAEEPKPEE